MNIFTNQFSIFDKQGTLILKTYLSKKSNVPIHIYKDEYKCLSAIVGDNSWLWQLCFGHLNFQSLKQLTKQNMVKGFLVLVISSNYEKLVFFGKLIGYDFSEFHCMQNNPWNLSISTYVVYEHYISRW